ncbi:MAG: aldehyde dehydrogenase [Clostridia bacterium]|nr:aldehyde dehydrogenase [Clostridia bacterium]
MNIAEIVAAQRSYFGKGETLDLFFRRAALKKLRSAILAREAEINAALKADLNKSSSESYMCEIGMTLSELNYVLAHMGRWAKKHRVLSPLAQFHARSFTVHNPYGVVLIMSPWNYPFMLTLEPLIGAIAAGNCCVVKPSAYAPATSSVIRALIADCFPPEYVAVVEGGRRENQALLDQRFDYIFFTGGVSVGREVMRRASEHLTPVSLELGGKSPCIVDSTAKLDLAAKRIAFGKLLNCGQTCVAPDYLLIDRKVKDAFLGHLKKHIVSMIGGDALENDQYVRMVSRRHYDRVMGLIDPEKVVFGGKGNPETLHIQPTIMDGVTAQDAVMQEEIFGPVLPVIAYDSIDEAVEFVRSREHPLALYLFSEDKTTQERFLRSVPFGGGCLNDTIIHLATSRMGFGGVGQSGMGAYHGKKSFETFSHEKSVVSKSTWMDLPVRYMPYSDVKDRLLRLFLR